MLNNNIKHIHCIGIGGIGVSGIASVLHKKGYMVSGSDLSASPLTNALQNMGITIYCGHHPSNIKGADLIVYSTAIGERNPEFALAKSQGIPMVHRAKMLVELMKDSESIAVAGTHGKTTTTSLITTILMKAGLDPSFMIGGRVHDLKNHVSLADGKYFVAEADESDASFLCFCPKIAVVNNIEPDHMSTYGHDLETLHNSFLKFLHQSAEDGVCVLNIDDPVINTLRKAIQRPTLTYGFNESADIKIKSYQQVGLQTHFEVIRSNQENLPITLNLPGKHNVQNALAAISVASYLGIDDKIIQDALAHFKGIGRRFNVYDNVHIANCTITLVDDYGHHPTAISTTLTAARDAFPTRRIVLAFQPHRYSRTQELMDEFCDVLIEPDVLILLDVYSAGEEPIPGATGERLFLRMKQRRKNETIFLPTLSEFPFALPGLLQENDVLILQGAGNVGKMVEIIRR